MQASEPQLISLRRLKVLPNNPRKITQQKLNELCESIRQNGYYRHKPLAVEPIEGTDDFYILDGNQRKKALGRLKRKEAWCVIYTDLTEEERARIILLGNINNGEWVPEILQTDFEPLVDFEAIGLDIELPEIEPQDITQTATPSGGDTTPTDPDGDAPDSPEKMSLYFRMLGDYVYPSNNEFDIPTLLTDNMPWMTTASSSCSKTPSSCWRAVAVRLWSQTVRYTTRHRWRTPFGRRTASDTFADTFRSAAFRYGWT